MGDAWVNAHLLKGQQLLAQKKPADALATFQNALQFPQTLSEALGNAASRQGEVSYFVGLAYDAAGNADKAKEAWQVAANKFSSSACRFRNQYPPPVY